MSGLGNKAIFSKNLQKYIQLSGKTRSEICQDLKFSYSTFSEWVNGAKYPRIDKIEMLANYFGIKKSDLIEEDHSEKTKTPPQCWRTEAGNTSLKPQRIKLLQNYYTTFPRIPQGLGEVFFHAVHQMQKGAAGGGTLLPCLRQETGIHQPENRQARQRHRKRLQTQGRRMDGVQEVVGSIPIVSTKKNTGKTVKSGFPVFFVI